MIVRDTLKIECLAYALDEYLSAAREEAEARERYGGPSWGYFGASFIEAKERAAEEFGNQLDSYIDRKLDERLGPRSNTGGE